jgi:hypothetical protein
MISTFTLMPPRTGEGREIHLIKHNEYIRTYNVAVVLTAFENGYLGHQLFLCWQIDWLFHFLLLCCI